MIKESIAETKENQDENKKNDEHIQESESDIGHSDDEHLMVIETPEGLAILENSSCGCNGDDHRHDDIELPVGLYLDI